MHMFNKLMRSFVACSQAVGMSLGQQMVTIGFLLLLPLGLGAAGPTPGMGPALDFVDKLNNIILTPIVFLLGGVAMIVFMWGGFMYILNSNNEQARDTGKRAMFWGLIGLLVMTSAYAILRLALATVGLDSSLDEVTNFTP